MIENTGRVASLHSMLEHMHYKAGNVHKCFNRKTEAQSMYQIVLKTVFRRYLWEARTAHRISDSLSPRNSRSSVAENTNKCSSIQFFPLVLLIKVCLKEHRVATGWITLLTWRGSANCPSSGHHCCLPMIRALFFVNQTAIDSSIGIPCTRLTFSPVPSNTRLSDEADPATKNMRMFNR